MQIPDLAEGRTLAGALPLNGSDRAAHDAFFDQALAQWIEVEGRARMLVDDALIVRWMSPSAESLVSTFSSILVRNGRIHTRENRFDRELRELIVRASPQVSACCICDRRTNEQVVLTAVRLNTPRFDMVGLTLQRATEDFPFRLADLSSAFGFTQTEGRVAHQLMCGHTAEETARVLGVSLETVRTHIKRAYAKLGVSSREAFFHRLTPFMVLA